MGRLTRALLLLVLLAGLALPTAAGAETVPADATTVPPTLPDGSPDVQARSWLLVDVDSGQVLTGSNEHTQQLPASTVKMMTALTALRILGSQGAVQVSENAAARPAMRIGMVAGQVWPIVDTLWCLLLVSANDAAYALAETASGSLEGFAAAQADTARQLGMVDSTFADPAGFDHPDDTTIGPNQMSAWDLAIAGRAVLADPVLAPMVRTPRYDFVGPDGLPHTLPNHNKLLQWDPTVIGVKTGYTRAASGTFVAAAERNGRRLLGVVMGASDDIYTPMNRLFEYGFALPAGTGRPGVLPAVVMVGVPTTTVPPTTVAAATTVAAPTTVAPTTTLASTTAITAAAVTTVPDASEDPEAAALNGAAVTAPVVVTTRGDGVLGAWPILAGTAGAGVAAAAAVMVGGRAVERRGRRRRRERALRYLGDSGGERPPAREPARQ